MRLYKESCCCCCCTCAHQSIARRNRRHTVSSYYEETTPFIVTHSIGLGFRCEYNGYPVVLYAIPGTTHREYARSSRPMYVGTWTQRTPQTPERETRECFRTDCVYRPTWPQVIAARAMASRIELQVTN